MGKYKLQAGAEIDLLTPDDMRDALHPLQQRLDYLSLPPRRFSVTRSLVVDGTGNLGGGGQTSGAQLFVVPTGFMATVHRVVVAAPQYTPQSPLTTGWIAWGTDGSSSQSLRYFLPQVVGNNVIPAVVTDGNANASMMLRSGESFNVWGAGLINNLSITFTVQYRIWPSVEPITENQ